MFSRFLSPIHVFGAACFVLTLNVSNRVTQHLKLNEDINNINFSSSLSGIQKHLATSFRCGGNVGGTNDANTPLSYDGVRARAFRKWKNTYPEHVGLPCYQPESNMLEGMRPKPKWTRNGFLYLKLFKTGSSTSAGINLRIARNVAQRLESSNKNKNGTDYRTAAEINVGGRENKKVKMCKARFDHVAASRYYGQRKPQQSFLWTVLRDPDTRAVSQFFHFEVSRGQIEPSDENFRRYLHGPSRYEVMEIEDLYLRWLSLVEYKVNSTVEKSVDVANGIVQDYDFIGISERMEESAVAIAMILDLPLSDVMFLSSKRQGDYDDGGNKNKTCTFINPSFVTRDMDSAIREEAWQKRSRWDRALYRAANRSLDMTIERLGRDEFDAKLARYRKAMQVANNRCIRKTVFPCTGGEFHEPHETDCLWTDSGCGFDCLDSVANELRIDQ